MIIIDSNIWAYYFDRNSPEHHMVTDAVEASLSRSRVATNTVILIEVAHFLIKNLGAVEGMEKFETFLRIPFTLLDLDFALTKRSVALLARRSHKGIGGRDATIIASAESLGIRQIMTHDQAFKEIEGIEVIDPIQ